jgi:hypothetical protein
MCSCCRSFLHRVVRSRRWQQRYPKFQSASVWSVDHGWVSCWWHCMFINVYVVSGLLLLVCRSILSLFWRYCCHGQEATELSDFEILHFRGLDCFGVVEVELLWRGRHWSHGGMHHSTGALQSTVLVLWCIRTMPCASSVPVAPAASLLVGTTDYAETIV